MIQKLMNRKESCPVGLIIIIGCFLQATSNLIDDHLRDASTHVDRTSTSLIPRKDEGNRAQHILWGISTEEEEEEEDDDDVNLEGESPSNVGRLLIHELEQSKNQDGHSDVRRDVDRVVKIKKSSRRRHRRHKWGGRNQTRDGEVDPGSGNVFPRGDVFETEKMKEDVRNVSLSGDVGRPVKRDGRRRHSKFRRRRSPAWMMQAAMVLCDAGLSEECQQNKSNHSYNSEE